MNMSMSKLLSRIVAPSAEAVEGGQEDHTYGITSDPMIPFACVFAALIHDVDHPGISNAQLIKEDSPLAKAYNNKSIAEQNSVDIAWALLNEDTFTTLRNTIAETHEDMAQFRQLVVQAVLATDILDKDIRCGAYGPLGTCLCPKCREPRPLARNYQSPCDQCD